MKVRKLSCGIVVILVIIVGIRVFILSGTDKNLSKASSDASGNSSILKSDSEVKSNSSEDKLSATLNANKAKYDASSEVSKDLNPVSSVLDLNKSFISCHSEPADVDANSGATGKASIYGKNLSVIPTQVLINKAIVSGKNQSAEIMGIGIDFKPMIVVTGSKSETKISIDFTAYDDADGEYSIVNTETNTVAASFSGKKDVQEILFTPTQSGGYSIIRGQYTLGIIEVVDKLESTDLEQVRKKYLK